MKQSMDFEMPGTVRDAANRGVEQAKEAYVRMVDATRQAQDMMIKSAEAMTSGMKELQEKSLQYTETNITAGFDAASRVLQARDFREALEIQGQFARKQFETYAQQAQEISRVVAQAAQKAQPTV